MFIAFKGLFRQVKFHFPFFLALFSLSISVLQMYINTVCFMYFLHTALDCRIIYISGYLFLEFLGTSALKSPKKSAFTNPQHWLVANTLTMGLTLILFCGLVLFHSFAIVSLCSLLWVWQQTRAGRLPHNASTRQPPPSYRALQLGWIGRYKLDVPRGETPVPLLGPHIVSSGPVFI